MSTEKQTVQEAKVEKDTKSASSSHQSSNKNFRGQIFGPGIPPSSTTPERAIATAGYALSKERDPSNLTPDHHMWMVLFTSASCPKIRNPFGAYSVVAWHDKQLRMAWYMPPESEAGVAVTEKRLAGLAIAQALYIADERLRALPDESKPKSVTIKIFSSCEETLRKINDPGSIKEKGDKRYSKKARLAVVRLIEDLSQSLCNIAGVEKTRVYLQWLPTSYPKMQCARDFAKKCRRKSGGKDLYVSEEKVKRSETMPEGVYKFVEEGVVDEEEDESGVTVVEESEGAEVGKKEEEPVFGVEEAVDSVEQSVEDAKGDVSMDQDGPAPTGGEAVEQAVDERAETEEGRFDVGQPELGRSAIGHVNLAEAMDLDDEMMDDGESTATERGSSGQPVSANNYEQTLDNKADLGYEQTLIDQQLFADFEFSQSVSNSSSPPGSPE